MSEVASSRDEFPAFSIFRALRVERHEVRHSNFLAWLINPQESHGQGVLFLRLFLDTVARVVGNDHAVAAKLRTTETSTNDIDVSREKDRLDLRVVLSHSNVVIGIEDKVFASEHSDQLARYAESIQRDFPGWDSALLYLTLDGDPPSDVRWLSFTHRHVLTMIEDGIHQLRDGTPLAVCAFIEHYVALLRDIYSTRSTAPRYPAESKPSLSSAEDQASTNDSSSTEKPPGLDEFEALMRKIVQVPKAEVYKLMAEQKAARAEQRRLKNNPS